MTNLKDRVTIYEVAKASGVSLATVSRVINNQSNVTKKTKEKVLAVIERLGYKPSALAQALATNHSTNIGVIIPSANYVYVSNLLYGLTEEAKERGFVISLFVTSHVVEEANKIIERVISSHVDGAIIFDDALGEEDITKISSYNVPTIVINNHFTDDKVGCVYFGYEHLLKRIITTVLKRKNNKKEVTFLRVDNGGRLLSRMEKACEAIHKQLKMKYNYLVVDDSYKKTYSYFKDYFKKHKNGYFIAYRDSIAKAIINAASDAKLNVPKDVEVLSIIGTKYAHIVRPTLSAMHIDMVNVGRKSMTMLSSLINKTLTNKEYKFESEYIKRESTLD